MPNRLASATSPYLLQHADNPVDWWEWGPDAFVAARERNVPVLLSVGYAACHWCHVAGLALKALLSGPVPAWFERDSGRSSSVEDVAGHGFRANSYQEFVSPGEADLSPS